MNTFSLTRRLISAVLLVELCSAAMLVVGAGSYEWISRFHAFDVMLRGRADSMLGAVQDAEDTQDNVMLDGTQLNAPRRDIYAVRDERGVVLGHSPDWSTTDALFDTASEFSELRLGGHEYRVIRIAGLRIVDPGDKNGGIARHVIVLYGASTRPVWKAIGRAITFYTLLSLLLLCTTALLMLRLLRTGLRPLHDLAFQAALVSAKSWKFQPSAEVLEVRELAPLAVALKAALNRLEQSFEQQRQFVGDAAHELKTSAALVKSSLQVLLMKNRNPEEYRRGLERAEIDCERMEQLVANMLTLASLESALPRSIVWKEIDLNAVMLDVIEQFRTSAELSRVRLKVSVGRVATVNGQLEDLRVLCSNLVQNALQHTSEGGEIRTSVHVEGDHVKLYVDDDGEGISPEALPHVFDRFYRGDASRSRLTGGTGLGLAIAKAIVESHQGSIEMASELGQGTWVKAVFPLASSNT